MKTPDMKKLEEKKEMSEGKKKQEGEKEKEKEKEKAKEKEKEKEKKLETMTPWDIASGAATMSDYNFRGITQTAHHPSVAAYFEPRYNFHNDLQGYVGLSAESILF